MSTWNDHLKAFHAEHPELTFKQCMTEASKTWKKSSKEPAKEEKPAKKAAPKKKAEAKPKSNRIEMPENLKLLTKKKIVVEDEETDEKPKKAKPKTKRKVVQPE